jgi:hypothetical protein
MSEHILDSSKELIYSLLNEADKTIHDSKNVYDICQSASNTISLLLTHITSMEYKLQSLEAEIQRLSLIARY